jgi:hypothetical protein
MPRTLVKKVMLCAVGALALELALAQQQPAEKKVAFEVATIKLAASNAAPKSQMVRPSPNRISIPSMTLNWLIYTATAKG